MRLAALSATAGDGTPLALDPSPSGTSGGEAGWQILRHGQPIGRIGVWGSGRQAEIDFGIHPAHRGRGYATEALRAAAQWTLDPDGGDVAVLLWRAEVGNWAARRVVWSCGFRVEGQVRGLVNGGTWPKEGWIGALTRDEPLRPLLAWYEVPRIEIGDVLLRPNQPTDAGRIVEACTDPLTQLYLPKLPRRYDLHDADRFLSWQSEEQAGGAGINWAIANADEPDTLIGQIGLRGLGGGTSRTGEIGYWMHPDGRCRGLARASVRAVCRHALLPRIDGGLGLARVLVRAAASNTGSVQVARTAGLTETGRDRDAEVLGDGTVDDHLRFDLLASELDEAWAHPSALR